MERSEILSTLQRIITDQEFRTWFAANPKEALVTLGLSRTATDTLVRMAPIIVSVVVAGVIMDLPQDGPDSPAWNYKEL